MVGIAAFALPVKLKGTQKRMAEAAVGTKSLGAMFAAALAAPDKISRHKQSLRFYSFAQAEGTMRGTR